MAKKVSRVSRAPSAGGKVGAVLLGVLIGFVGTVGGVAGAGYIFATTATIESVTTTVGSMTGTEIDYKQYVTEEYAKQTIVELVGSIGNVANEFTAGTASFNTLNKISPKVAETVEGLVTALTEYGVEMTKTDVMEKPFVELGAYLSESVQTAKIGTLLNKLEVEQTELLLALCYGEEGVHYTKDGEGNITMLGDYQQTTLGDLMGDMNPILDRVPLSAILEVAADDNLMQSIAYGNSYCYTVNEDGSVTMNQEKYVLKDGTLYDEAGKAVTAEEYTPSPAPLSTGSTAQIYKITKGEGESAEIFYAFYNTEQGCYLAYQDAEGTLPRNYKRTSLADLISNSNDLLSSIELASVMKLDANSDPLMLALAFGDNYVIDGDKVYAAEGTAPVTVGELMDEEGLGDIFDNVKLGTILDIDPLANYDSDPSNDPDSLMLSLAYGEEGTHYRVVDTDADGTPDSISYIGDNKPRTLGYLMEGDADIFRDITLDSILDLDKNSDTLLIAMAFGKQSRYHFDEATQQYVMNPIVYTYDSVNGVFIDDHYETVGITTINVAVDTYKVIFSHATETQTEVAQYVSKTDGVYYAYETQADAVAQTPSERIKYSKTLLADLMGSNATQLINDVQLSTVFGVSLEQTNADPFMLALSFGYEGTHYVKSGDTITWKTNPETGKPYEPRTISDLRNSASFMDDLRLETILDVDAYSSAMLIAICYGEKGTDYTIEENVDHDNDPSTPAINVIRATNPRTIGMLKNDPGVFDNIALDSLLTAQTDDAVTMYLLYGKKDVHYSLVGGSVQMKQMQVAVYDGVVYDVFGKKMTNTTVNGLKLTYKDVTYDLESAGSTVTVNVTESTTAEGSVYNVFNADGTEKEYKRHTIGDLSNGDLVTDITNHLTIGEFLNVTEDDGKLLNTLKDKKFGDLNDAIPNLKVGDVLEDDEIAKNRFLKHLYNSTLTSMGSDINSLSIQTLFEDQVYETYQDASKNYLDANGNKIYYDADAGIFYADSAKTIQTTPTYLDKNGNILYYNEADGKYYTTATFDAGTQSARALRGSWKYMLSDIETGVEHTEYTISHVEDMVKQMTDNMHVATLRQLSVDGIVQIDNSILNKDLMYSLSYTYNGMTIEIPVKAYTVNGEGEVIDDSLKHKDAEGNIIVKIGEMNIEQILQYTENLLGTFTG